MLKEEKQPIKIGKVKAFVKDVKVTTKGIQLNLENVSLTGEQISLVSALVGGPVWVDVEERVHQEKKPTEETPENQLSIFDTVEEETTTDEVEKEEEVTFEADGVEPTPVQDLSAGELPSFMFDDNEPEAQSLTTEEADVIKELDGF